MIIFPNIDRVAFTIFGVEIYWYALSYIAGIMLGKVYANWVSKKHNLSFSKDDFDKLTTWIIIGIIFGGRLGHVLFFEPDYYISHPIKIFALREGGMAFHGGMIGVIVVSIIFCKINKKKFLELTDILAATVPIGLFLGRIANFINAEICGRPTDLPWGVIFPSVDMLPRHPSQLYEALLEGLILFLIFLRLMFKRNYQIGLMSSLFCIYYGVFRFFVEFTRQPEENLSMMLVHNTGLTMGQWLCVPVVMLGVVLYYKQRQRKI